MAFRSPHRPAHTCRYVMPDELGSESGECDAISVNRLVFLLGHRGLLHGHKARAMTFCGKGLGCFSQVCIAEIF